MGGRNRGPAMTEGMGKGLVPELRHSPKVRAYNAARSYAAH